MIVVKSSLLQAEDVPGVSLKTLFPKNIIEGGKARFGMVTIPPKGRIPLQGQAPHSEDEYSILVKGSMITSIGDKDYYIKAGDATLIPAGEAHAVYNDGDEDSVLIWVLVDRS